MKTKSRSSFLIIILLVLKVSTLYSQENEGNLKRIPSVKVKDIEGSIMDASQLSNDGKPFILCFWKTCCKPPLQELDAIDEVYSEWQEATGVKVFAISVDDSRSSSQVGPYAIGQGYEFELLLDPNSDLKRAMNVNVIPTTFICDGNGDIIWQKSMFVPGDEDAMLNILKQVVSK